MITVFCRSESYFVISIKIFFIVVLLIFTYLGMLICLVRVHLNSKFGLGKRSRSYIGMKITFFVFLSIYSQGGATASWATQHTTVCLDI